MLSCFYGVDGSHEMKLKSRAIQVSVSLLLLVTKSGRDLCLTPFNGMQLQVLFVNLVPATCFVDISILLYYPL